MPQIIDTLHFSVAVVPLALYLLAIGMINLIRRPIVVSGAKDAVALGLAVSGMVIAGPMELFLPAATAFKLGALVWVLLLGFYFLSLTLIVLLMRPRIVIYNVGPEKIRPILANVAGQLDNEARWAGDCLYLPTLGVQLHAESASLVRNVQLVANGAAQSFEGWARLEKALRSALEQTTGPRNLYGLVLVMVGMLLVTAVTVRAVHDAELVAQSLKEMLRVEE